MGLFSNQLANVIEWEEYRDDIIFWKWANDEIKKGSRLIIRQGQDAIFMYNGKIEGIFKDEGSFDVESAIIPFLSTLKGFKFGFNSGIRAEVLFVNTKEFTVKWGTKNPINLPAPNLPGGMPIRAFGNFNFKVSDYLALIDTVAGVKKQYSVEDVRERVLAVLDQLLMKWIAKEGKDMFNLQANAYDISKGIASDLDMELIKLGITVTGFNIQNVSYPEEVQKMQETVAAQSMIGSNMGVYQNVAMLEAMKQGRTGGVASDMAGLSVGMAMGQQMAANYQQNQNLYNQQAPGFADASGNTAGAGAGVNFCPSCGTKAQPDAKFCMNCGAKLR